MTSSNCRQEPLTHLLRMLPPGLCGSYDILYGSVLSGGPQVKFMALAFGGKELVNEEDPSLDLRKIHYRLIRDKGLGLVSIWGKMYRSK